jgi:hypothetical protein
VEDKDDIDNETLGEAAWRQSETTRRQLPPERRRGEVRVDILIAMPRPKVMSRLWAPLASMAGPSFSPQPD